MAAKPYGPAYQDHVAKVALEHGCNTAAMACLYWLCRKIDWATGVMPNQLSHKALGKEIGGSQYTVYRAMRQLREAGVIDYQIKGNDYDGGEANTYRFKIPAIAHSDTPNTPPANVHRPPYHKRRDPPSKNAGLNPYPSLSRGEKAPASRGAAPDVADGNVHLGAVSPWDGKEPYGNYLGRVEAAKREALRAAENG